MNQQQKIRVKKMLIMRQSLAELTKRFFFSKNFIHE